MKFSTYYFHVKTYILAEFQICISVPLNINENPYIINQVSDDSLDPVEKCINKYKFPPSILLIKNRIKIQNLFSFHAIDRNDMMSELLKIDPKKQLLGTASHPKH